MVPGLENGVRFRKDEAQNQKRMLKRLWHIQSTARGQRAKFLVGKSAQRND